MIFPGSSLSEIKKTMYSLSGKKVLSLSIAILLSGGLSSTASAHHSRSNFDMDTKLEFSGTITEYSWRNPHTFATVAVEDESGGTKELLFELNSVSVLSRAGWTRDTLQVGDRITVVANPDLNANKNLYYSNYWVLPDGNTMVSTGAGAGVRQQAPRQVDAEALSEDFSGIWRVASGRFSVGGVNAGPEQEASRMSLGGQGAAVGLPLTAIGHAEHIGFDAEDNPWFRCVSKTPPWLLSGVVGAHRITRENNSLTIRHEINDVDRTIHLGMTEHPIDTQSSHLGHSIGWFEGETLLVDTAHFSPAQWGIGGGVSSSEQKHLVESFTLADGGRRIDYEYTMTDPVYLTHPITISTQLGLDVGYPFQDEYGCDPEASSRHIVD
tara:strand:- start:9003 stop:10145 length:1143 start_codon:yes stop_codon:yes gene_type:complete